MTKKKKVNELNFTIVLEEEPEGGFTVTVPALPGCVSFGETIEEARTMAREAIELHLEGLLELGWIKSSELTHRVELVTNVNAAIA
ncbi:MAG: type II toxin-antitoxin system HicB family antitoxin [Ignavibacteriae bacterium]|nr:type II toxin-antitoxin system HicB family antitoxin [Ignavibacteriota bacterium]